MMRYHTLSIRRPCCLEVLFLELEIYWDAHNGSDSSNESEWLPRLQDYPTPNLCVGSSLPISKLKGVKNPI